MACDICGKVGTYLTDLRESYQTSDIKSICPECEDVVNRKHGQLLDMTLKMKNDLFVRFIRRRKEDAK